MIFIELSDKVDTVVQVIVTANRRDNGVHNEGSLRLGDQLMLLLESMRNNKISIANPAHAPYGRAAMAALTHEGLGEKLKDKFVLGENVSQAAQFVESGSAEAGIIALSLAVAPAMKEKGRYVEVPAGFYPPLQQGCVVLAASKKKVVAGAFVEFLKKSEIVDLLKHSGFGN